MAFRLERVKTTSTPYVLIDEEQNYMRLEGQSFHENVIEVFTEINDWLENYLATDFGTFTFDCAMKYFNSSTVKALFNMLAKMDKAASDTKKVIVNWITTEENEIVTECGEDFRDEVSHITFNLVIN